MRRSVGKRYLATLPTELHRVLREAAEEEKQKSGGHLNLNRVIVPALRSALGDRLTTQEREAVDNFIATQL